MADRYYEVQITITRTVKVRVPVDDPAVVFPGEDPKDVAEEFAMGGFDEYVISRTEDSEIDGVSEYIPAVGDGLGPAG